MIFTETTLKDVFIIQIEPCIDERGSFARLFCKRDFESIGHFKEFVQCNYAFNPIKGTLRGMHYQKPPYSEIKLVKCTHGAIFDVIIDIRIGSATYMKWISVVLNEKNNKMIYIPEGFAHGYQTLESNSEILYMVSDYYHPEAENGIRFDDPFVKINWELPVTIISDKDRSFPLVVNKNI